ncbi:MAG: hypothetical protein KGI19_11305 [Thaumarchaeota archaeon]|nr:hypothetical protein [Nitrososphaerota archaeon]MDE1819175.1 hypothetical protein [Nitrososphaerota archaeon]
MEKKIDVTGQVILGAIPAIIPQLYAFYRIKKLRRGIIILIMTAGLIVLDYAIDLSIHMLDTKDMTSNELAQASTEVPNFSMSETIVFIMVETLLPMYFARKWTLEYNEKIISPTG